MMEKAKDQERMSYWGGKNKKRGTAQTNNQEISEAEVGPHRWQG